MIYRILIFSLIVFVGCQSKQVSNLPTLKASRDEAVIMGKLSQFEDVTEGAVNCGATHCYATIEVDSVLDMGQDFTRNFEQEKPIKAFFTYGADGADSTTHSGLQEVLVGLKPKDNIVATIKLVGELEAQKLYQINLYKKLN